jgi:hypothetical protein
MPKANPLARPLKARLVVVGGCLYQFAYVGARNGPALADIDMFLAAVNLLQ